MCPDSETFYGTCVAINGYAALIRGNSGSGKSDLAYRCCLSDFPQRNGSGGEPFKLVSDDRVIIWKHDGLLHARAPETIKGLIELRGVGLLKLDCEETAAITIIVDLVDYNDVPRMQIPFEEEGRIQVLGITLPCVKLFPFESSAPLKLAELIRFSSES